MTPDTYRDYIGSEAIGPDGYPAEWHRSVKHAVRAAAGHRCIRCGHPYRNGEHGNGEWSPCDDRCTHGAPTRTVDGVIEARWRILTVHHLDEVKTNCRWWNLVALCQRCHLSVQSRVQMARVWPWEHTAWFRPYVAGYYAWTYLGEDLSRGQVLQRLDELLALERMT